MKSGQILLQSNTAGKQMNAYKPENQEKFYSQLSRSSSRSQQEPTLFRFSSDDTDKAVRIARQLWNARSRRNALFDAELFGEPSWDIMLDIFVHQHTGVETTVSSACYGSRVPQTTALRHVANLEAQNLLVSSRSVHDGRLRIVKLTDDAVAKMKDILLNGFDIEEED
jgi:hypothetical protein